MITKRGYIDFSQKGSYPYIWECIFHSLYEWGDDHTVKLFSLKFIFFKVAES